jgi:NADPH2:quinone reductase
LEQIQALVCSQLGGEDLLEYRTDWPVPDCGPDELRIEVRAASANFPDNLIVRGLYQDKSTPPFVPGSESAGVVSEVGRDLSGFAVGDRVMALGGTGAFASVVVASPLRTQVHRLPDEMSFEDGAAFCITYGTAINALKRRARVTAGESVLVLGAAGGCGTAAVQVAKAMGARVIAVAGGSEKCALAAEMGADAVIDHLAVESISGEVRQLTDGNGVDVLFDPVGSADGREQLRCLAWHGRFLVVGFASGQIPQMSVNYTLLKAVSIVGVIWGAEAVRDPAANNEDLQQLFDWYRVGKLRPAITQRFALAHGAEAMRTLYERRALGKVVVEVSS